MNPSSSFRRTKWDDVRDGKFFHIRVTVVYLTAVESAEVPTSKSSNRNVVSCFASFCPTDEERGEYDFATSMPLAPVQRQTAKWPKGDAVKTSKRRLYHSVILRADDSMLGDQRNASASDDESSTMASPSPYLPELLNIYVGVKCGEKTVPIGVATLVLSGRPVTNQRVDLPVHRLAESIRDKTGKNSKENNESVGVFKKLFGGKNKKDGMKKVQSKSAPTFPGGDKKYSVGKKALLQVKLDVMDSAHEINGPGLWGDLEDDEESFGPVPVIDIPGESTAELSGNRYQHESIEVMQFKKGTTIIQAPGKGEAEEKSDKDERLKYHEPSKIEALLDLKLSSGSFYLCGADVDEVSEMPLTSSITEDNDEDVEMNVSETIDKSRRSKPGTVVPRSKTKTDTISEMYSSQSSDEDNDSEDDSTSEEEEDDNGLNEATRATNLLLRYASRFGVPVEDLLEAADSGTEGASSGIDSRLNETSSYPGSTTYPGDRP
jgi:hypothetical protein